MHLQRKKRNSSLKICERDVKEKEKENSEKSLVESFKPLPLHSRKIQHESEIKIGKLFSEDCD